MRLLGPALYTTQHHQKKLNVNNISAVTDPNNDNGNNKEDDAASLQTILKIQKWKPVATSAIWNAYLKLQQCL